MTAPQVRVRPITVYVIEARLDRTRPWKRITDGVEWPAYHEIKKAVIAAARLHKDMPRKRR